VDEKFKKFAPIYRKQYSLAYLSQIQDELEQRKEEHTQFLKQRVRIRYLISISDGFNITLSVFIYSYEIDKLSHYPGPSRVWKGAV